MIPAGPAEMIASGGLTDDDIQQLLSMTVREGHLASLFDTVQDVVPWATQTPDWKEHLAMDCARLLKGKAVVK